MDIVAWEKYLFANLTTIVGSVLVAVCALWLARFIRNKLLNLFLHSKRNQALKLFLTNCVYTLVLVIAGITILGKLGVPTASVVTLLGASSLAIGLALKDFLSNIAAGVILVFQKPFEYGDLVEISGTLGVVEYIDLFNVKIKTSSNEIVVIPNGMLIQGKIINKAYRGKRRLEIIASIAYDSDLIKAKTLLNDIVLQVDKILKDPAPSVAVSRLAESSVDLSIKMWLKKEHYLEVQGEVLEKIKLIFDKNDIQIPYPQMELSVKKRLHS